MNKLLFIFLILFVSDLKVNAKESYEIRYCYENTLDTDEDKSWTKKKYDKAFSYLSFDPSSYLKYLSEEGKKAAEKEDKFTYNWMRDEYVKVKKEKKISKYLIQGGAVGGGPLNGLLNYEDKEIQDAIDLGGQLKRRVDRNKFIIIPEESSITHARVFTIEFIKDYSLALGDNNINIKKELGDWRRRYREYKISDVRDNTFFAELPSMKQKLFLDTINRSVEINYPGGTMKYVCEIEKDIPKKTGLWIVIFLALISYFVYSHSVQPTKKVRRRKN